MMLDYFNEIDEMIFNESIFDDFDFDSSKSSDYFDYFNDFNDHYWLDSGGDKVLQQIRQIKRKSDNRKQWDKILRWVKGLPLYAEVTVNGKDYLLSHAGFDVTKPLSEQHTDDCVWNRTFFKHPSFAGRYCVFGHTVTSIIHNDSKDQSIWRDPINKDKIGIDCGCAFGGSLSALRLDDGEEFYVTALSTWGKLSYKWKNMSAKDKALTIGAVGGAIAAAILIASSPSDDYRL